MHSDISASMTGVALELDQRCFYSGPMLLVAAALLQAAAVMSAGATPPASLPAPAPVVAAAPAPAVSEVVVTADPAGLLERRPTGAVFGLPLPLLETPRSATFVSAQTLDRYGARTVDDLVAVAPGTFTDSYYGVPGALNVRGTLAETYFDGFKRIENRGTYPTLLGSAEEVQIVRGPPTPAFGPGKVGGLLDLVPHSARDPERGWPDAPTGYAEAGGGSYGYGVFDGEVSAPLQLGALPGGGFLYVEAEDGPEYYRGVDPKHLLLQGSVGFDLAPGWRLAVQAEAGRYEGAVQTPGWNRLTQALIDHGTYITGRGHHAEGHQRRRPPAAERDRHGRADHRLLRLPTRARPAVHPRHWGGHGAAEPPHRVRLRPRLQRHRHAHAQDRPPAHAGERRPDRVAGLLRRPLRPPLRLLRLPQPPTTRACWRVG